MKKMLVYLTLLIIHEGFSMAYWSDCMSMFPSKELIVSPIPAQQDLDSACPAVLEFLDCYGGEIKEYPEDFDEYNALFYYRLGDLVRDLCTKETQIRTDYLVSVDCFKENKNKFDTCLEHAESVYRQYKNDTRVDESFVSTPHDEKECFTRGHAVGCMTNEILQACGELAHATYMQLVQRSKYINKFCKHTTAEALNTKYLAYLNKEENIQKIYSQVLDYEL